jgi:hypothetical protein
MYSSQVEHGNGNSSSSSRNFLRDADVTSPTHRKVVWNDNLIVTECRLCPLSRGRLVQAGVMLSLLRKRFVGS